jgi:hypothetical protein
MVCKYFHHYHGAAVLTLMMMKNYAKELPFKNSDAAMGLKAAPTPWRQMAYGASLVSGCSCPGTETVTGDCVDHSLQSSIQAQSLHLVVSQCVLQVGRALPPSLFRSLLCLPGSTQLIYFLLICLQIVLN